MKLNEAKKEAWKNQNPVILKVEGYDEYIWMPLELWESQASELSLVSLEFKFFWDKDSKKWIDESEF